MFPRPEFEVILLIRTYSTQCRTATERHEVTKKAEDICEEHNRKAD